MSQRFSELMTMRASSEDRFLAVPSGGKGFLYGGLTMGMGLTAAAATVGEGLVAMSLRCSFVSFGRWGPTDVHVERLNTSRSFAGRRTTLTQDGKLVAAGDVAFHRPESGVDDQHSSPPDIADPSDLDPVVTLFGTEDPVDPVEMRAPAGRGVRTGSRIHPYWARIRESLGEQPAMHAAGLAFLSDYMVIHSPFEPGAGAGADLSSFTLEHTLWFHRPIAADQWMLFDCLPLTQHAGRYVSRGAVYDEQRVLIASFVQEGFVRPRR